MAKKKALKPEPDCGGIKELPIPDDIKKKIAADKKKEAAKKKK